MKKSKIVAIVLAVLAILSFGACTACDGAKPIDGGNVITDVCYYGCPNSKRVKKLNLLKKKVR